MAVINYNRVVKTIFTILGEDTDKRWTQTGVTGEVNKRIHCHQDRVGLILKTLWSCDLIHAREGNHQRLYGIRYKETDVDQRERFNKQAKQYQDQILGLQQENQRLQSGKKGIAEVHIKSPGKKTKKAEGLFHECFPDLVALAECREEIFLFGPTGCGKSHVCKQLADALGLDFYFVSCTAGMSEGQLNGRLLPIGDAGTYEYVMGEFVKAYENGGVFLLDEMDAADGNVLLAINAALANGRMPVPNRPDKPYATRHADFVCVAAANTVGLGASRMYSGRNRLDGATLDRFAMGTIMMDYDEEVERQLVDDHQLRERFWGYRRRIREANMERAVSTRAIIKAHKMKTRAGWSDEKVDQVFFTGWKDSEVRKAKGIKA
jgi:hypothetical protein